MQTECGSMDQSIEGFQNHRIDGSADQRINTDIRIAERRIDKKEPDGATILENAAVVCSV